VIRRIVKFLKPSAQLRKFVQKIFKLRITRLSPSVLSKFPLVKYWKTTSVDTQIVVMGNVVISKDEWEKKKLIELSKRHQNISLFSSYSLASDYEILREIQINNPCELTVIVSVYRPGDLFDSFLGNLIEQSIFSSTRVNMVLVDPIDSERKLAEQFADRYANVILEIVETRISIYSAWNIAIAKCSTPFITNMNIDDIRSVDSLEVQLNYMKSHPWVDVGYQDFFYLLDKDLDWTSIANIAAVSQSPPVTLSELVWFGINSPHNGPIWKSELHARFGLFDERLRSAGDYEFWIRVVSQGGVFAKMSKTTVGYFLNPDGMSTSIDSPSTEEEIAVREKYRSKIKLKSDVLPAIYTEIRSASNPWDGAEELTEKALDKLREVK
jgi:hypothetical protein